MMYDVSDDELADARELEAAAEELRSIAGGPGGWAAGTVMDEYDRMRAELAEAKAEIARLTEERDTMRALIKQENGLMISNLVADLVKRRNIAATAAAYVESCLCNGGTDVPALNTAIDRAFAALVAAVEEGNTS